MCCVPHSMPTETGIPASHAILHMQQYWVPQGRAGGRTLSELQPHTGKSGSFGLNLLLQKHAITGKPELAIDGKVSFKVAAPRFPNKPAMWCRQRRDPGSWAGQHLHRGQLWILKKEFLKLALEAQMSNKPSTRQMSHLVKTPNIAHRHTTGLGNRVDRILMVCSHKVPRLQNPP